MTDFGNSTNPHGFPPWCGTTHKEMKPCRNFLAVPS